MREVEMLKEFIVSMSLLRMLQMDLNNHTLSKVLDEHGFSQEDRKFLTMVESETKVVDGHYQVPLPFQCDDVSAQQQGRSYQKSKLAKEKDVQRFSVSL